jgi:hypothetical protein
MTSRLNSWVAGVLVVVCVVAQVVVAVPHHHHDHSEVPCFNITHCVEHDEGVGDANASKCSHDHCAPEQQPTSDHHCTVKVDVAEVAACQPHHRCPVCELGELNDFFALDVLIPEELITSLHSFTLTRWRQQPVAVDKYALFIASVHPTRAPSILS